MLFNSLDYALFLTVVVAVYFRIGLRAQNVFLLAASYFFYGSWDWRFLSLILLSTVVDYVVARKIEAARSQHRMDIARRWLVASIVTSLGILGFFKYSGFFVDGLNTLLTSVGLGTSSGLLEIIVPVGISFYTFQTMSYTIDVYRGDLAAVDDFVDFALFVAFFPQLVAGPIERATHLIPQIRRPRVVTTRDWERGIYLILVGLVRKVVIADTAAVMVDKVFAAPAAHTSIQLAAGMILYAIQIYGDFAGYSDIARGSANLLGFQLMRNFRHPYFAMNPSDFWRRWHISLSTWLRDYLYIPLGGNRKGRVRTYINLMLTMTLGGLWHGAAWSFVLWGFGHGVLLAVHRAVRDFRLEFSSSRIIGGMATFLVVALLFMLFRSHDLTTSQQYLSGMFALTAGGELAIIPVLALTLLLLAIDLPQAATADEFVFLRFGGAMRAAFATAAVVLIVLGGRTSQPFIYFQF